MKQGIHPNYVMMGMCLYELDTPVTKTTNAILAFGEKADKKKGIEDLQLVGIRRSQCDPVL